MIYVLKTSNLSSKVFHMQTNQLLFAHKCQKHKTGEKTMHISEQPQQQQQQDNSSKTYSSLFLLYEIIHNELCPVYLCIRLMEAGGNISALSCWKHKSTNCFTNTSDFLSRQAAVMFRAFGFANIST